MSDSDLSKALGEMAQINADLADAAMGWKRIVGHMAAALDSYIAIHNGGKSESQTATEIRVLLEAFNRAASESRRSMHEAWDVNHGDRRTTKRYRVKHEADCAIRDKAFMSLMSYLSNFVGIDLEPSVISVYD